MIIPNIWKNKKCSKPPTRSYHTTTHEDVGEPHESSIAFHALILRCSKCHIAALSARGTISFTSKQLNSSKADVSWNCDFKTGVL